MNYKQNKFLIVGRLTADPELMDVTYKNFEGKKETNKLCKFTLAENKRNKSNTADFFPVSMWGDVAVNAKEKLKKGTLVEIEGELKINKYQKEIKGEKVNMKDVEIRGSRFDVKVLEEVKKEKVGA